MRSLPDEQIEALAADWANALRRGEQSREDEVHQSVVMLSFFFTPEVQWKFILASVKIADGDELGAIAAGPFEGLMGRHGENYIDRVEQEAARDPSFREMLGSTWQHMMNDAIWTRVQAAGSAGV